MEEKNYLDIEATAAQVKKGIEEIVAVLTTDVLNNNNKVFTFEVDTDGISENPTPEELLERARIILKKVEADKPLIESQLNEMIIGNGENWGAGANWFIENKVVLGDGGDNSAINSNIFGWKKESSEITSLIFTDGAALNNDNIADKENSFKNYNFFQLGENSNVLVRNGSDVKIGRTSTANNTPTRIHIYDGAAIDIDGGLQRGSDMDTGDYGEHGSPEIFIHGNVSVNIDDGVSSYSSYNGSNSVIGTLAGSSFYMHDKALLSLNKDSSIIASNRAQAHFNAGYFAMQTNRDPNNYNYQPTFIMNDGAAILMNGGSNTGQYLCNPCLCLNGGGTIVFNAQDTWNGGGTPYDPYLLADPTGFIFIGQGSEGAVSNGIVKYPLSPRSYFGSKTNLIPSNKNPQIKISDETMIIVDAAQGAGANWIKIGADRDGLIEISLTGNIFQQMEHNAHSEMHHNSKFIMRGQGAEKGWKDERNVYISNKETSHLNQDWTRPVRPVENDSPILGLYDVAQFTMRGVWDTSDIELHFSQPISIDYSNILTSMTEEEKTIYQNQIDSFINATDDNRTLRARLESGKITLPEEIRKLIIEEINEKGNNYSGFENKYDLKTLFESDDFNNLKDSTNGDSINTTISRTDVSTLYIQNVVVSNKPFGWHEHLDKINDQPVIEVIENADVRIYGNSELKLTDYSIIANSEGFTFKDNTIGEEVSFSIAELKQLKTLLENSTIN